MKSTRHKTSNVEAPFVRIEGRDSTARTAVDVGPRSGAKIGPFVLVQQIGRGGFAPVWLAREMYGNTELRTVALKLFSLDPQATLSPSTDTLRVIEEARSLCKVEHPHIVRFYSIVIDEAHARMGLAMEYLAGTPLDRKLKEQGPVSVVEAVKIGLAIASALAAIHRSGIVHRDVKPANIVETDSTHKLIDFGIALGGAPLNPSGVPLEVDDVPLFDGHPGHSISVRAGSTERREIVNQVGTIGFIDPECLAQGARADALSDLYSLGATLFQLVTGEVPAFSGGLLRGDVLGGRRPSPRLAAMVPSIPHDFARLVDALLAPRREQRPRSADWVATRLQQILGDLAGHPSALPSEAVGPFRGLSRFEVSDQGVYFGRALEVAQALQILRVRGLVALLGASGSGKSSLARAGVVPAILAGEMGIWPAKWDAVIAVPGADPRAELLRSMQSIFGDIEASKPEQLIAALSDRVHSTGRGIVLLVDQLEELATISRGDGREWLVELLGILREQPLPGVRAIVTARRDLLDPLLGISGLGRALLHNAILIEPMTPSIWTEVLERALAAYGYSWESEDLRRRIASEIDQTASAMPLVQFALARLWERRDVDRKLLTWRAYQDMGGIGGALAQHAESTLASVVSHAPGGETAARRTLLALSTPQGTRAVRDSASLERLAGAAALGIVQAFEQARLVVRLPSGYTLAHEALLTGWQRLDRWLAEARDARVVVEQLEHDSERWSADRDNVPVWRRRRLAIVEDALEREGLALSETAQAFHHAGLRAERRRRLGIAMAITTAAAVALGASVAYVSAVQTERARTQTALAGERSSRLEAEARAKEVQAAQQRIDQLLRGMPDSTVKAEVVALQQEIRDPRPRPKPEPAPRPVSHPTANPPAPTASDLPPAVTEPMPAAREPPPAPPQVPRIRVQSQW